MDVSAIRPNRNSAAKVIKSMQSKAKTVGFDPGDASYHELAQMPGWANLKKYIERRKTALKSMVEIDLEKENLDLEEIGLRFMIVDLAIGELDEVIRQVERSSEYIDEETTGPTTDK